MMLFILGGFGGTDERQSLKGMPAGRQCDQPPYSGNHGCNGNNPDDPKTEKLFYKVS